MRPRLLAAVLLLAAACGGGGGDDGGGTGAPDASPETTAPDGGSGGSDLTTEILGEDTQFAAGGDGASDLDVEVDGRECKLTDVLFGSCRAATGAGGVFVVTAEGNPDDTSEWNMVVRCGLDPAVPVASARGTFTPQYSDLGLEPYGEVFAMTLTGADEAEASLVFQPEGAACPVVWGLGPVKTSGLFVGGTDALNGDVDPIQFTMADGTLACITADGAGGLDVSASTGGDCSAA